MLFKILMLVGLLNPYTPEVDGLTGGFDGPRIAANGTILRDAIITFRTIHPVEGQSNTCLPPGSSPCQDPDQPGIVCCSGWCTDFTNKCCSQIGGRCKSNIDCCGNWGCNRDKYCGPLEDEEEPATCLPPGPAPCTWPEWHCCSRFCNALLQEPKCCELNGGPCSEDSDCCLALTCNRDNYCGTLESSPQVTSTPTSANCVSVGGSCVDSSDCCFGDCKNNYCEALTTSQPTSHPTTANCAPFGGFCVGSSDCCLGVCRADQICCKDMWDRCNNNEECCSETCVGNRCCDKTGGRYACPKPKPISRKEGMPRFGTIKKCATYGGHCNSDSDCCRDITCTAHNHRRCCAFYGGHCTIDNDCCGDITCSANGNSTCCTYEREHCTDNSDCCGNIACKDNVCCNDLENAPCKHDQDCCKSFQCVHNKCVQTASPTTSPTLSPTDSTAAPTLSPTCVVGGQPCFPGTCCTGSCLNGFCYCDPIGHACRHDHECCSNKCRSFVRANRYYGICCTDPGTTCVDELGCCGNIACTNNVCCNDVGGPCKNSEACCDNLECVNDECVPSSHTKSPTAPTTSPTAPTQTPTCVRGGEPCFPGTCCFPEYCRNGLCSCGNTRTPCDHDHDCCSNKCRNFVSGTGRCCTDPGTTCVDKLGCCDNIDCTNNVCCNDVGKSCSNNEACCDNLECVNDQCV